MKLSRQIVVLLVATAVCIFPGKISAYSELHSDMEPYWTDKQDWSVYSYPNEAMCEAATTTVMGEYFTLAYFPKEKSFGMILSNSAASSLEDGVEVDLEIALMTNGKLDLGWGKKSFSVSKIEKTVAFTTFLTFPIEEDLAKAASVTLLRKSTTGAPTIVAHTNLERSAPAIKKLIECAHIAADSDPADPFLK